MNLATWAERNGVARVAAYRWFRAGLLPVPARKVGRLILVDEPTATAGPRSGTAVYARVSSADQKADLDRQVARVTAWTTAEQIPVDKVVVEVGSALNGHRRMFRALLGDPIGASDRGGAPGPVLQIRFGVRLSCVSRAGPRAGGRGLRRGR
jgi:predicted site-specific integrase-resolvase